MSLGAISENFLIRSLLNELTNQFSILLAFYQRRYLMFANFSFPEVTWSRYSINEPEKSKIKLFYGQEIRD